MMYIRSLKHKTLHMPITEFAEPPVLYLPLYGYKGTVRVLVQPGESVKKYQKVAVSEDGFVSVVHAPVSGIADGVEDINGKPHLKLINDFKGEEFRHDSLMTDTHTVPEILLQLKEYGIEGAGGARFPTHLKYDFGNLDIDVFIINGAECEPYLSADYALLKNEAPALLKAIVLLQEVVRAKRIVIAIEKQHKELKKFLASHLSVHGVEVCVLPNEYPQGGELQLIKSVTGQELPKGSIPAQYGVVVSNVGTLWAVYNAFYNKMSYVERVITISGEKAQKMGNYSVKIGTPVSFLMEELGVKWDVAAQAVILGGPMMGQMVVDARTPINKGSGGLLVLPHAKGSFNNCIQCGYCTDVCPQRLMPMEFARPEVQADVNRLLQVNLNDCIECGACAYICPSDVPLMKNIFNGKHSLKEG